MNHISTNSLLMSSTNASAFSSDLQFCPLCGSVLPLPQPNMHIITCMRCSFKRDVKDYDNMVEEFTIHFNSPSKKGSYQGHHDKDAQSGPEFQGPTVDRPCPRCHHDTMTYTTRQTRSADEGQTVFYTCVKCKFQDIEYS